jgi:hypothetical protein
VETEVGQENCWKKANVGNKRMAERKKQPVLLRTIAEKHLKYIC